MGNPETRQHWVMTLYKDKQMEIKRIKHGKLKDLLCIQSIKKLTKQKKAQEKPTWIHKYCFRERNDLFIK
jgi:hypothetical protein